MENRLKMNSYQRRRNLMADRISTLPDRSYLIINRSYNGFSKFIYRTMRNRDHHQPITTFRLQCGSSHFNLSDVNRWVNSAVQRGLENLYIQLFYQIFPKLIKSCIFSCKTLVVLKLFGLNVDVFSFVHLPSLKTLQLYCLIFPEPQYVMELLSGCPILEYMHLSRMRYADCSSPSNTNVKSLTKLVSADISFIGFEIPLKVICNVEFLRIDKYPYEIPVFPNLTHLELMMSGIGMNWHLVLAMLKKCPKLQKLLLDMKASSTHDMVWTSPFNDPECLSSQLRKCSITNYKGTKSELHFATYIMQSSRVLQTMAIDTAPSSEQGDKFEMIKELSLCPRSSAICQLSFK
ncbi:probable FBD-associated F-box protein At1g32375 [Lotus japonicus]|uniref:probable FBD-associated F-box protein At1g32375 n=1 Tax=Lotus japonicus TaxID=34305 RepID=UPI00258D09A9|nr:probable FBD-associated F-box protein At1g32375 [Lotus japonicus]